MRLEGCEVSNFKQFILILVGGFIAVCVLGATLATGESPKPHDRVKVKVYYKTVPATSPISP